MSKHLPSILAVLALLVSALPANAASTSKGDSVNRVALAKSAHGKRLIVHASGRRIRRGR